MKKLKIRRCERPKGAKQSPWIRGDCFVRLALLGVLAMTAFTPFCFAADKQPQTFPFTGKINQDNVNIRAGANKNFEILSKVNNGDLIFVAEESYGWYKVRLPQSAHCYVAKAFIEKKENDGISKANNLNLRVRPDRESSILGQIKKDGVVTIVADDNQDWYEILPPEGCYGWISAELIEFYSSDMTKAEIKASTPEPDIKKPKRRFLWW